MWSPTSRVMHTHIAAGSAMDGVISTTSVLSPLDTSSCQSFDDNLSLSPPLAHQTNSLLQYTGSTAAPDRMMTSRHRVDEELCLICGDRASGYHYNALSCEGCKGFFRRSITRNAVYVCKYGGRCEMDMWMRRKCQACRLQQCRNVGMKEECLLSERQCVARNARRQKKPKSQRPRHRLGVISARRSPTPVPTVTVDDRSSPQCQSLLDELNEVHRGLISRVVMYQDKYELPSPIDIEKVSELKIVSSMSAANESDAIFGHMVEMTILVTRLVVEFAKHLPGFQNITKEDQIALLKASSSEVMILRASRRYDPETDTIVFGDGTPFTANALSFGSLQCFIDAMFEFSRGMASMGVDNAEYALLVSLCIFSDRPGVVHVDVVQRIQDLYTEALIAYVTKRRVNCRRFLAKLLMKLVELRTLNTIHTDCLYKLTIERGSLPPLLREYYDIPSLH